MLIFKILNTRTNSNNCQMRYIRFKKNIFKENRSIKTTVFLTLNTYLLI